MTVRQEESTPIGDYFHDSGVMKIFDHLTEEVDEFEVDTEQLSMYCDHIIASMKGLQAQIKKVEKEYSKFLAQKQLRESTNAGCN